MQFIENMVLNNVIEELALRARKARRARFMIGVVIVLVAASLSSFIAYRLTDNVGLGSSLINAMLSFSGNDDQSTGLTRAINNELSKVYPETLQENSAIGSMRKATNYLSREESLVGNKTKPYEVIPVKQSDIDLSINNASKLVDQYVKIGNVINARPVDKRDNTFSHLISTLALSAGAVAFTFYILQVAVGFVRYYSKLAELYDSQKTALIASNGDVEIAKTIMSMLSNDHVSLGKEPSTLYDKALDVISEVAKQKS